MQHGTAACPVCDETVPRKEMKRHQLEAHNMDREEIEALKDGNKKFFCHVCKKGFVSAAGLSHHRRTHEGLNGPLNPPGTNAYDCQVWASSNL